MSNLSCLVGIDLGPGYKYWESGYATYRAHFDYSPGRPGVHTLRNGDPGYPDEPAELVLTELERNGVKLEIVSEDGEGLLTDDAYEKIEAQCWEFIMERNAADDASEYEAYRSMKEVDYELGFRQRLEVDYE